MGGAIVVPWRLDIAVGPPGVEVEAALQLGTVLGVKGLRHELGEAKGPGSSCQI